jgi:hypothetical protein
MTDDITAAVLRGLVLNILEESAALGEISPSGAAVVDWKTGLMPGSSPVRPTVSLDSLQRLAVLAGWQNLGEAFTEISMGVAPALRQQPAGLRRLH